MNVWTKKPHTCGKCLMHVKQTNRGLKVCGLKLFTHHVIYKIDPWPLQFHPKHLMKFGLVKNQTYFIWEFLELLHMFTFPKNWNKSLIEDLRNTWMFSMLKKWKVIGFILIIKFITFFWIETSSFSSLQYLVKFLIWNSLKTFLKT